MGYKTNALDDAFAWAVYEPGSGLSGETGLTKREFFAALALAGLMSNTQTPAKVSAQVAVEAADYLIEALNGD